MRYLLLAPIVEVEYNGKQYNTIGFKDSYILCDGKACRYDIVELTTINNNLIAMKSKLKTKEHDGVIAESIVNLEELSNDVKVLCTEYSHSEVVNNKVIKYHRAIIVNNECNNNGFNIKV